MGRSARPPRSTGGGQSKNTAKSRQTGSSDPSKRKGRPRRPRAASLVKGEVIRSYAHEDKPRKNTPPVGLVGPDTDADGDPARYPLPDRAGSDSPEGAPSRRGACNLASPHSDPTLCWFGKREGEDVVVPTVSLHLHERIDPTTIIGKALKKEAHRQETLVPHFEMDVNNPPLGKAIQFYRHTNNWSNRLIAGDSLMVMNSLLTREDLAGSVQLVFIDPPYGIKYGSNFQPFVNKKEVIDRSDDDLAYEPETVRAFRDTWNLGIHSWLSYLRDRLVLTKELLTESGSCVVQISDENLHYVRMIMDEVFGADNFVSIIPFRKAPNAAGNLVPIVCDYMVLYAKNKNQKNHSPKYHQLYYKKSLRINDPNYRYVELNDDYKTRRKMTPNERANPNTLPVGSRIYCHSNITSPGKSSGENAFEFNGEVFRPGPNRHWSVNLEGMKRLADKKRLVKVGNILRIILYDDDSQYAKLTNMWTDTTSGGFEGKIYVVQTVVKAIRNLILMTTDPGDLVLDPTCGSGTTAYVAEQYGRRWITCDTQRVALALAKRRLMTARFKYYQLRHPEQGVGAGFSFVPPSGMTQRISTKSLAYDEVPELVILHDRPDEVDNIVRVTGPFTVEAVPSPVAASIDTMHEDVQRGGVSGEGPDTESARQEEWRAALRSAGLLARDGGRIEFVSVEPHPSTKWIHAAAVTNETDSKSVMVSFGPPYAPLDLRQVEAALQEVRTLKDMPRMLVFAAMQFDPEAAKFIDDSKWPGIDILKAQMSTDMLVGDLRKADPHADSFMLLGQPDVLLMDAGNRKYKVKVIGFDYYDAKNGRIESGGPTRIAMWMLDTDYDGRSLYPQQVFFPMSTGGGSRNDGWGNLARALRNHIDPDTISLYAGTESIEFEPGEHGRVAVKIIDDRGIELIRVLEVPR